MPSVTIYECDGCGARHEGAMSFGTIVVKGVDDAYAHCEFCHHTKGKESQFYACNAFCFVLALRKHVDKMMTGVHALDGVHDAEKHVTRLSARLVPSSVAAALGADLEDTIQFLDRGSGLVEVRLAGAPEPATCGEDAEESGEVRVGTVPGDLDVVEAVLADAEPAALRRIVAECFRLLVEKGT